MREEDVSARVMVSLNGDPNILAFKIHDRSTIGVPDIIATGYGSSTWLETKNLKGGMKLWQFIKKEKYGLLQLEHMRRLARAGRAWFLVFRNGGVEVWHPDKVYRDYRAEFESKPVDFPDTQVDPHTLFTAIQLAQFEPMRITQKIYDVGSILIRMGRMIP